jgi:hypothetical protein
MLAAPCKGYFGDNFFKLFSKGSFFAFDPALR